MSRRGQADERLTSDPARCRSRIVDRMLDHVGAALAQTAKQSERADRIRLFREAAALMIAPSVVGRLVRLERRAAELRVDPWIASRPEGWMILPRHRFRSRRCYGARVGDLHVCEEPCVSVWWGRSLLPVVNTGGGALNKGQVRDLPVGTVVRSGAAHQNWNRIGSARVAGGTT